MNENECGKALMVIGKKECDIISRFVHFKRLRNRPADQTTKRRMDSSSYRSARTPLKKKEW